MTAGPVVTLHVWRVGPTGVPAALLRMALDRGRLRRTPGVRFAKLLGTGRGSSFRPTGADPCRWAALVSWADGATADGFAATPVGRAWQRLAVAGCRLTLAPTASRGTWAGVEPFTVPGTPPSPRPTTGPTLVLTRARLRARTAGSFWRAIGPVGASLTRAAGLHAAFGIGEAPLGFQGTISVWRETADITRFAYRQPEHTAVVTRTRCERWYAEELFARFTVLDVAGDREVIGWREATA